MKKLKHTTIILLLSIISGCITHQNASQSEIPREIVLSDGMRICATDNNEQICVVADGYTKRIISWDGEVHPITLISRKKRWHGELGLISPKQPENIWKTQHGYVRALITEAQIRYDNVENAVRGLRFPFDEKFGYNKVYNDSGLLIKWHKTVLPDYDVLDLAIFQIFINEEKPKFIPESNNDKIIVTWSENGEN